MFEVSDALTAYSFPFRFAAGLLSRPLAKYFLTKYVESRLCISFDIHLMKAKSFVRRKISRALAKSQKRREKEWRTHQTKPNFMHVSNEWVEFDFRMRKNCANSLSSPCC